MTIQMRALLLVAVLGLSAGCSDTTELGLSLVEQERSDLLFTDTLTMDMAVVETMPFSTISPSRWLCGAYEDPVFGKAQAGVYFNFRIPTTNVVFPTSTVDSLVLTVVYDTVGHYGSALQQPNAQTWEAYEMDAAIDINTTYRSNSTFALKAQPLAQNIVFTPNYRDSIDIDTTRLPAHLRIRLDNAFAETLLEPTQSDAYTTNNNFKSYFKGIHLRPVDGAGNDAIIRFLPKSAHTKLTLYYTDLSGASPVAKSFSYLVDTDAEAVVTTSHDYTGTDILSNNPADSFVYLQGMNGVGVRVQFPTLANLGRIVVNKAEIQLQSPFVEDSTRPIPPQIVAAEKLDTTYELADDVITSLRRTGNYALFGGSRQNVTQSLFRYRLNVSQYMQRIADGEVADNSLYIQAVTVLEPYRLIFANQRHSFYTAKLLLTYTKID